MLDALAGDDREVWWMHGARNGAEHASLSRSTTRPAQDPHLVSHAREDRSRSTSENPLAGEARPLDRAMPALSSTARLFTLR
jgi:hypothetical protein